MEIKQAVILCAGRGSRTKNRYPKILRQIGGISLLERHLQELYHYGINEFIIVTGYNNTQIEQYLQRNRLDKQFNLKLCFNPQWNKKENGYSVYVTRKFVKGHFFVVMGDHLFDYAFLEKFDLKTEHMIIFVDSCPRFFDPARSTKVFMKENGRIMCVGKNLISANATEIGFAYCPLLIYNSLQTCIEQKQNAWNDAQDHHARTAIVYGFDIKGTFWTNNNTQEDFKHSRRQFMEYQAKKRPFNQDM